MLLDTRIPGSVSDLDAVADELTRLEERLDRVYAGLRSARGLADYSWDGPAHEMFDRELGKKCEGLRVMLGNIDRLRSAVWSLASYLAAAQDKAEDAREHARKSGLRVEGTVIYGPTLPSSPLDWFEHYYGLVPWYLFDALFGTYKTPEFSRCEALVAEARKLSARGHQELAKSVGKDAEEMGGMGGVEIGSLIARMLAGWGGMLANGSRRTGDEITAAEARKQKILSYFHKYGDPTGRLREAIEREDTKIAALKPRLDEWERFIKWAPDKLRNVLTEYPGKKYFEAYGQHHSQKWRNSLFVSRLFRGSSYRAMLLLGGLEIYQTAFTAKEAYQTVDHQQSWGKAGADFVAGMSGSAFFGAVGAAFVPAKASIWTQFGAGIGVSLLGSKGLEYVENGIWKAHNLS